MKLFKELSDKNSFRNPAGGALKGFFDSVQYKLGRINVEFYWKYLMLF